MSIESGARTAAAYHACLSDNGLFWLGDLRIIAGEQRPRPANPYSEQVRVSGFLLPVALAAVATLGCAQPRSELCKKSCTAQATCLESSGRKSAFDEDECVAACSALERDKETAPRVTSHAACVEKAAGDCQAILKCP
jgi:hypothetical protein